MFKKLMLLLLFVAVFCATPYADAGTRHSSSGSSKTVHVPGYTKKDGTYVAPHDRRSPGSSAGSSIGSSEYGHPYRSGRIATGYTPHSSVIVNSHGKIKRSGATKDAFKRQRPCPSTGRPSGSCPSYVIDHVKPLECGGADDPSNMQWQTVADGKAKDKTERYCQ